MEPTNSTAGASSGGEAKRLPIPVRENLGTAGRYLILDVPDGWMLQGIARQQRFEGLELAAAWENGAVLDPEFEHGIRLINEGSYYAAHDALEDVWRGVHGWTKPFYQGMVQVAISLHHFSTGNLAGAQSVMAKCRKNLDEFPESFSGVNLRDLIAQLEAWQRAMTEGGPYPAKVVVRMDGTE